MADKYYCKYCDQQFSSVIALTNLGCSRSPTKKHVLYEGTEKSQYICKHCGQKFRGIVNMVNATCHKSPTMKHEPAL